jgi:23S rRNA pseudouridine1911/1915/1917 synthase
VEIDLAEDVLPIVLLPEKENIPIEIVYEDQWLLVVNKPAGMTTHPAPGSISGTLVNALLYHYENSLSDVENNKQRPGIVHRLDKDTSGLIIVAKDNKTHYELSELFMNRKISKSYLCICVGVPEPSSAVINKPICRHRTNRKKMAVIDTGKEAISRYQVLKDFDYFSLLEVEIETGRTHQIRVHLESINHPVLGDNMYNTLKRTLSASPPNTQKNLKCFLKKSVYRQALHAWKISFVHPKTGDMMNFVSDIPEDMVEWISYFENN